MKKNFIFALMSAIALTGVTGLTACSDKDELVDLNPGYNAETGEVPVNFVFNVSRDVSTTRMSAAATQATLANPFRGISDANLLAVKLGTGKDGKHATGVSDFTTGTGGDATINAKRYNLGELLSSGEIGDKNNDGTQEKSHRVVELSLPTESNALLFWGRAKKTSGDNADHLYGKLDVDISSDLDISKTEMRLCRVVPNDADDPTNPFRRSAFEQYQNMIAAILTNIIQSEYTWNAGTTDDPDYKTMKWVDYVREVEVTVGEGTVTRLKPKVKDPANPTNDMCALGEILADAFCSFNTIYESELRAGCGSSIARMMGDLYAVVDKVYHATGTGTEEEMARSVAFEIITNIEHFFTGNGLNWQVPATLVANCKTYCGMSDSQLNLIRTENNPGLTTPKYPIDKFPEDYFHLPKGSTILEIGTQKYTSEAGPYHTDVSGDVGKDYLDEKGNKVYYYQFMGTVPTYAMGGASTAGSGSSSFDPRNYMYPPELSYFGNSPIRITDDAHSDTDFPDGPANWTNEASWVAGATGEGSKAWETGHVLSTTRSVAMKDNINYGTALLETKVSYGTDKLEDNNAVMQNRNTGATESNNIIDVSAKASMFKLTGILVGGQHPVVGWNYLPLVSSSSTSPAYSAMVYDKLDGEIDQDKFIPKATSGGAGDPTASTYTLVFDNWEEENRNMGGSDTKTQRTVYIALEFLNNSGLDFWGQNNLIRNGGTFYLVGKLDPDVTSATNLTALHVDAAGFKADKSLGVTWPTDGYALPPYNSDGSTTQQRRVFIQDYKTTANFVIDSTSLQHALVAVPDLRAVQISLGLSVDLSWSNGLQFENIVLGAN